MDNGKNIYVIGPFLGDRIEQFDTEASEAFFLHLNSSGELVQQLFLEGAQGFLPLGLSGPFLFGNYKGLLRIRKNEEEEPPVQEISTETTTPKAFVAKYENLGFRWFTFLDVRTSISKDPLLTLTSIADDFNNVYVGGSFRGCLVYENQGVAQNKCAATGFLLKINGDNGDLLWTRNQNIGYDSADSTYLDLSVGGKRYNSLFTVSLICDEDLVILEKIGSHGAKEKKVKVEHEKGDEFYRIYADGKYVYLLSFSSLRMYDLSLRLLSKTEITGMVGNNYVKPLTSLGRQLYLGLGAQKDFTLGNFLLSRVSPESILVSDSQSLILGF